MAIRSPGRFRAGPLVALMLASHLVGDDVGDGGLAQAGRAVQQDMLGGFAALLGGLEGDTDFFQQLFLADTVGNGLRPQGQVVAVFLEILFCGVNDSFACHIVPYRPPAFRR